MLRIRSCTNTNCTSSGPLLIPRVLKLLLPAMMSLACLRADAGAYYPVISTAQYQPSCCASSTETRSRCARVSGSIWILDARPVGRHRCSGIERRLRGGAPAGWNGEARTRGGAWIGSGMAGRYPPRQIRWPCGCRGDAVGRPQCLGHMLSSGVAAAWAAPRLVRALDAQFWNSLCLSPPSPAQGFALRDLSRPRGRAR